MRRLRADNVTIPLWKTCINCGKEKPASSFNRVKSIACNAMSEQRPANRMRFAVDGLKRKCRACYKTEKRRREGSRKASDIRAEAERKKAAQSVVTQAAALRELKSLLIRLLGGRCVAEGRNHKAAQYQARWQNDSAFRARERRRQQIFKHANPDAAARYGERRRMRASEQSDGTLTPGVIKALFAAANVCPYCAVDMRQCTMTLDHKTPLSRGGAHGLANVTVCCLDCNREKRDMPYGAWLDAIDRRLGVKT